MAARGTWIHRYLETESTDGVGVELHNLCKAIDLAKLPYHGKNPSKEAAYFYDVDTMGVRFLGNGLGRDYSERKPTEIPLTIDVCWTDGDIGYVADHKTGFDPVYAQGNPQLELGALCYASHMGLDTIKTMIIQWDEYGDFRTDVAMCHVWDLDMIHYRMQKIYDKVVLARKRYADGESLDVSIGTWCRYCPCMTSCPSHLALVKQLVSGDMDHIVDKVSGLSTTEIGDAWMKLKRCKEVVDTIEKALRGAVEAYGSVVDGSGNTVHAIVSSKRSVSVEKALPVLSELGFNVEPMVKKSLTLAAIQELSGKEWPRVLDALEYAGAVSPGFPVTQIRTKKAKVAA
jgi:hypothetical protein